MKPFSFQYESMGTHWVVSIWDKIKPAYAEELQKKIISLSEDFDKIYSRFIPSSFISKLSTKSGRVKVPPDFMTMLLEYKKMFILSEKKFTPLVGSTLSDMGYDKDYSLKSKLTIHKVPDMEQIVTIIDDSHINLKQPVLFDFGALGKGYFVEKIKNILLKENLKRFLVDGSGDIAYVGNGVAIQTGLEHPLDSTKVIGTVEMDHGSMCSSGSNRRSWGKYHHIIDPQSRQSVTEILATWVLADSATIADGLATALFLTAPEQFQDEYDFEYLILNKEMKVKRSVGFKAQLF